jgi:hypothetical protein
MPFGFKASDTLEAEDEVLEGGMFESLILLGQQELKACD